ncbi:MAG: TAXI family TRAP transporter solute-binding subunit [bacterium]
MLYLKSLVSILISSVVLSALLSKPSFANLTIATGSEGGNYYPVGKKIAEILNQNAQGLSVDVKTTHGSVENLKLLADGKCELAIVQSDILYQSYFAKKGTLLDQGLEIQKSKDVKGIIALFPEYIQIVIRKGTSNIKNIIDLAGLRVSLGKGGSGTYKNAIQLLETAGLSINDIHGVTKYGPEESVDRVIDGELDAAFLTCGSIIVNEEKYRNKIKLLSFKKSILDKTIKEFPYYSQTSVEVEKTTYRPRVPFVRAVLVSKNITKEQAYAITRTLFENWKGLLQINAKRHTYIEFFRDKALARKITIPLHPGAEKFYIEKGLIYTNRNYYTLFFIFLFIGLIVIFRKIIGQRLEKLVASNRFLERSLAILDSITSKKTAMVVWGITFIFSMDILLIKQMEASYSFYHDIPTPFENLSFGDTLLWLLIYASTGYTQGIFPVSNLGKICSIIIPFFGNRRYPCWNNYVYQQTIPQSRLGKERIESKVSKKSYYYLWMEYEGSRYYSGFNRSLCS